MQSLLDKKTPHINCAVLLVIYMSKPVSRVLFSFAKGVAAIYLGCQSPGTSSDLYPRESAGNVISLLFSLAPGGVYLAGRSPGCWCALTAPLHPYFLLAYYRQKAVYFCGTVLKVAPTGRYPAPCPTELGLSSKINRSPRLPGLLIKL